MEATDSHKNPYEDFRRYHAGDMSAREQFLFEKRLLDEPLFAEAYEGYLEMTKAQIDYPSAVTDLNLLLKNRVDGGHRKRLIPLWVYATAASVILSLGWLFYTNKPDLAKTTHVSENTKIREATPAEPNSATSSASRPEARPVQSVPDKKPDLKVKNEALSKETVAEATTYSKDILTQPESVPEFNSERIVAIPTGRARITYSAPSQSRGPASQSLQIAQSEIGTSEKEPTNLLTTHGRIVDKNGNGLPGVGIFRSDNNGFTTDKDGHFRLNTADKDSLRVSYIGYKSRWIRSDKANLGDVTLEEDSQSLSEVVVIGYGTQKKQSLTGAVSTAKAKTAKRGSNNVPTAHGRIVDVDGNSLPGVSVMKSGSGGSSTDNDGRFSLAASEMDTLKISSPGYKTKWVAVNKADLEAIKLDRAPHEEIVVAGYGAQEEKVSVMIRGLPSAQPSVGWENYRTYLQRKEFGAGTGEVKVSFQVDVDGSLSDFSASGPATLQKHAINLVKNGPVWILSPKNGRKTTEKVTVTVVFEKNE